MATLTITEPHDYRPETLTNIDRIRFNDPGNFIGVTARFNASQFGAGLIALNSTLEDVAVSSTALLTIQLAANTTFSAAGFVLAPSWSAGDFIRLVGTSGSEGMIGSAGSDRFSPGTGNDFVDGRAGNDTLVFTSPSQVSAGDTFDGGTDISGDSIGLGNSTGTYNLSLMTLLNVERIRPDPTDIDLDSFTVVLSPSQIGPGKVQFINGGSEGNAVTFGIAGNAVDLSVLTFELWSPDDSITLSGTSFVQNTLIGSDQDDTILGTSQAVNTIRGGGGADTMAGGNISDRFVYIDEDADPGEFVNGLGGAGDAIAAAGQVNLVEATINGVERLLVSSTEETGFGSVTVKAADLGAGHITTVELSTSTTDTLVVEVDGSSADLTGVTFLNFNAANRRVELLGTLGDDTLTGSAVHDRFFVGGGNDQLDGAGGDDDFVFSGFFTIGDADSFEGGDGFDEIEILLNSLGGTFDFSFGPGISGIESVFLSTSGNAVVRFSGAQIGDGKIAQFRGITTGTQSLEVVDSADLTGVTFLAWESVTMTGSSLGDTITGGTLGDLIRGAEGGDTMSGAGGNDTIEGGDGNDRLSGGAGIDRLVGGADSDTYADVILTGPNADVIVEAAGGGSADLIESAASVSLANIANVERLTLTGLDPVNGAGNALDNLITGNGADNILNGAAGGDTLVGGGGKDRLVGGGGPDRLIGGTEDDTYVNPTLTGAGADTIEEFANQGTDTVESNASISIANVLNVENITLTGSASINATGNDGANLIKGTAGVNQLVGGSGADTLNGGGGKDILIGGKSGDLLLGGADADTFRFAVANTGADTIQGFETAIDRFDLAGGTFSSATESGGNTRLIHSGGSIVITGVTGLSLAQWNALVLPAGGVAGGQALDPMDNHALDFPAPPETAWLSPLRLSPTGVFHQADFLGI